MAPSGRTEVFVASILNAAWMVRHYARGGRTAIGREHRSKAIRDLGIAVREAFSSSEDFEPLLVAVLNGLNPQDYKPPF